MHWQAVAHIIGRFKKNSKVNFNQNGLIFVVLLVYEIVNQK